MANLSDFLRSINITKENVMESDPMAEQEYVPFVVNRTLSYFPDTVLYANEMNLRGGSDHRLQFEYLINSVRAKKRFSRWLKPEKNEDVDAIKEYYNFVGFVITTIVILFYCVNVLILLRLQPSRKAFLGSNTIYKIFKLEPVVRTPPQVHLVGIQYRIGEI
jgi:hypothetical protein